MNKSVKNYLIFSLLLFVVTASLVAIFSGDNKDHKAKGESHEEAVSKTTSTTTTIPSDQETDQSRLIPNPCDSLSKKTIDKRISDPVVNGPLVQTAIVPLKACNWQENNELYPKLGVSIISTNTYYDSLEQFKVKDVELGDKSFIVNDFVTGVGGAKCGKTIIVKSGQFAYTVALCKENNKAPTEKELIQLAKEVKKSLG
ncbi:MAG: hypothetical protein U0R17_06690 [Acidimicrobiia bacterium]